MYHIQTYLEKSIYSILFLVFVVNCGSGRSGGERDREREASFRAARPNTWTWVWKTAATWNHQDWGADRVIYASRTWAWLDIRSRYENTGLEDFTVSHKAPRSDSLQEAQCASKKFVFFCLCLFGLQLHALKGLHKLSELETVRDTRKVSCLEMHQWPQ